MSPYRVREGREVYGSPEPYKSGVFVPGAKGELADLEEDGAVEWVEAPVREPKPKPKAAKS